MRQLLGVVGGALFAHSIFPQQCNPTGDRAGKELGAPTPKASWASSGRLANCGTISPSPTVCTVPFHSPVLLPSRFQCIPYFLFP